MTNDTIAFPTAAPPIDPLLAYAYTVQRAELLALLAGVLELAAELGISVAPELPAELGRQSSAADLPTLAQVTADELGADLGDILAIGETAAQLARSIASRKPDAVVILRAQLERELSGLRAELGE